MKNLWCEGEHSELDGSVIKETDSCTYVGHSVNMANNMKEELDRGRRAGWAILGPLKDVSD
ncbi:hypothetical protein KIN20_011675 [Parelaphostrongylus tenuis]|uniref:Uncharacterized protein n=1 Tax=Parelaphostrongylus tenuis TaxID=148309 RepID=A0AAD5M9T2_PARTN|nr:hypothetical protein KIN20_011675 [Parelaphostrongylus tenuis]